MNQTFYVSRCLQETDSDDNQRHSCDDDAISWSDSQFILIASSFTLYVLFLQLNVILPFYHKCSILNLFVKKDTVFTKTIYTIGLHKSLEYRKTHCPFNKINNLNIWTINVSNCTFRLTLLFQHSVRYWNIWSMFNFNNI